MFLRRSTSRFSFSFFFILNWKILNEWRTVSLRKKKKIEVATIKKIRGKNDEKYISSVAISQDAAERARRPIANVCFVYKRNNGALSSNAVQTASGQLPLSKRRHEDVDLRGKRETESRDVTSFINTLPGRHNHLSRVHAPSLLTLQKSPAGKYRNAHVHV